MANTVWTETAAARSVLAALRWLTVLPRTVRQDFSTEFVAGRGQTINVRGPVTVGEARVYSKANRDARDAIVFDDIDQAWYPVTMEDQVYKAVRLPDDFMTFNLTQLEQQVLVPQAESVVDGVTKPLIDEMTAVDIDASISTTDIRQLAIDARQELNRRRVPLSERFLALGPGLEAVALEDEILQRANEAGSDGVLREAIIGRLFGFTIVADPNLPDDYGVAYHRDAFAHVTRPSRNPEGAAKSATVAQDGFALRWLQHYNPLQLEDQSVVDTFVGASTLDPERAVGIGALPE